MSVRRLVSSTTLFLMYLRGPASSSVTQRQQHAHSEAFCKDCFGVLCDRKNVGLIVILDGLQSSKLYDTLVSTNCISDKLLGSGFHEESRQIAG